jgi:sugar phosphate isomerase/epimerase
MWSTLENAREISMDKQSRYTRRDFGKIAMAAAPLSRAVGAAINSKIDGVQLGAQSYSFRDLPLDDAIKAMAADGLGVCELFGGHMEPAGPRGPGGPADQAARQKVREDLRQWRTTVPLSHFTDAKKKFDDAGIKLIAYNYSFNNSFSDEEIERGFDFAKALGVKIITASTTLPVAKKVAPFAEKHKMLVAMHGHSNVKDATQFATPESFAAALDMSEYFRINLDIGHFTAAGYDPVDYINKHHDKIVVLHLKDRKKNQGENVPWGEGDTPIKEVLQLLKKHNYPIPALIEYEYKGKGTSQEEVKKCLDYARKALES